MMNKSIIKSTTTCPTKSADAQGQQHHDDEEASPSGSGSSHQKSLFCNTYALSEEQEASQLLHFNSMWVAAFADSTFHFFWIVECIITRLLLLKPANCVLWSTEIWVPDAMANTGHTANVKLELIESGRVLIGQDGIRQQEFSIRPVNICVESI
ncbi:hypothetical protein Pyn_36844 [Prunus yedoensis var. nudiflora]|uniref:Uncharacterized protein n=1 Tax=Prunus yedoensis var. nudiflora TaxID=2094558 RepID=A0A314ZKV3_PRUYE|nr:hypothetical protein Pyn_36844 [Prunus yedoensis var. nudiflora]